MHGATLLNDADEPISPCILWNDTRSHLEAAELDSMPAFRSISGSIVFPGFTAPKLRWIENNAPDLFEKVAKVLLPKDYLRLWLTGTYASEMSDASGTSWLDVANRCWSPELLKLSHMRRDQMPELVEGTQVSGELRSELAKRWGLPTGVVVAGGAGDNAASAMAVGAVSAGSGFISLGTSGVLFAANEGYQPAPASAVHTFCHALPNAWHQMGVILSATDALNWYAKLVGDSAGNLTNALGDALLGPSSNLFLPYLGGERTPHNDASIRGAFIGLSHADDTQALTRTVLEGVAFAFRDCQEALLSTGTTLDRLTAVGGGSQSNYWLSLLATVLNVPIDRPTAGDFGGAFGAARLGLIASEGADPVAICTPPNSVETFLPEQSLCAAFSDAYARFARTYPVLKDL